MAAQKLIRLCITVEALAFTLGKLDARVSGDEALAALLRMKLAALTTELLAAELIERAQHGPVLTQRTH